MIASNATITAMRESGYSESFAASITLSVSDILIDPDTSNVSGRD